MKELTFNPQINIQQCVLWQYANSPALRTLLQAKSDFYQQNVTQFWNDWFNDVFNINTATDFGLTVWGEILDFPRQIKSNTGQIHILTTEQYRTILKGQLLKFRMSGTAPQVNEWLNVVFGEQGRVYCLDNLDMTAVPFVFETNPSQEILWLLSNVDFLPRPAGVGYQIRIIGENVFGFAGSGFETFNNGTFYKDYNADIVGEEGSYQLSVNCSLSDAQIYINGVLGGYQNMVENTSYTWEVKKDNFISLSGSGVLSQDTTINVDYLLLQVSPSYARTTLNDVQATGAFFIKGNTFSYSYTVASPGFVSQSGSGDISQSRTIAITLNPVYAQGQTVYEQKTAGQYSVELQAPGFYQISLAGAGGGGIWTSGIVGSSSFRTGAGGGGGAAFKGVYQLAALSSYTVNIGAGGSSGSKDIAAGAGGQSSFGDLVQCLGGAAASLSSDYLPRPQYAAGGKINILIQPVSYTIASDGNPNEGASGGASLLEGYGAGGSYLGGTSSSAGTNGYIKIIYLGLTL